MYRVAAPLLAAMGAAGLHAQPPQVTVSIDAIEGTAWRARGVQLTATAPGDLRLKVGAIESADRPVLRDLKIHCARLLRAGTRLRCDHARFSARIPHWRALEGVLNATFDGAGRWQARIEAPASGLFAALDQTAARLAISARLRGQEVEGLRKLAAAFGLAVPGEFAGRADLELSATLGAVASRGTLEATTASLNYSEPSGRYAAENLAAHGLANWHSAAQRWELALEARAGQVYAEPLFFDFTALPLQAEGAAIATKDHWRVERLHAKQGQAGTLRATGLIARNGLTLESADAVIDAADLAPLIAADVQPFLIGTRLDDVAATGRAQAQVAVRGGRAVTVDVTVSEAALAAGKLGLSLEELAGELHWTAATPAPAASALRWRAGTLGRVPFGPSAISFRAHGADFELLAPWRQPLLDGALRVERLALRGLGAAQADADFRGALEPIDLAALCRALGWPVFGGTLGGQLPGLRVRDDVWSFDGALEAQVFDGTVRLENLHAIEPLGVAPRASADLRLRRLDLEKLTGTFAFGRITGRLDGDVEGLRLLGWMPVAFDGRLFTSPGDGSRGRISQRAIDRISAIGGGPSGLLSRGFLSFFDDFAYDRIGIRCVLRDGLCRMDGIEPARSKGGGDGYYLVKGRLLPRIDVVGYARAVSWDRLVEQVTAAQASGGPQRE